MGYIMTEDQIALRDLIRNFYTKELLPIITECDEKSKTPMHVIKRGLEMGLHMIPIPEEYGGMGLDDLTTQIMIQEMCRFDVGTSAVFSITAMALDVIMAIGNEEQKNRMAQFVESGKIGAFCLTEPAGGSDAVNMRTTATKNSDHYVLKGNKCFITNGSIADFYIVMAVTDKTKGARGISCFIVDRNIPGVSIGKHEDKIGMRTSQTNDVIFEDVVVAEKNLLGAEGLGFIAAMEALDSGRISVSSMALGLAQRALEEAVKYAKQRVVFGQPITNYQGISFLLADMAASIEACRALMKHTLDLKAQGLPWSKEASMVKIMSTDAAMKVTVDAVQILGGYGLCREYQVEKLMRDAKVLQIVEGTNQIQRTIIAKNIMKEY